MNLSISDRLRHVLVIGKTGSGKSRLAERMFLTDASAGHGLFLIDPHGDLALEIATKLPRSRINARRLIDASHLESSPSLNPFAQVVPAARARVVSALLATMRKIWPEAWGPRTEHILRHVFLAVLEVRSTTLIDAQRMLVDAKHRAWILKQVRALVNHLPVRNLGSST
jgi:hypothetical protein